MANINYHFKDIDSCKTTISSLDNPLTKGERIQGLFTHGDLYEVVSYDPHDITCAPGGSVVVQRIEFTA